MTGYGVAEGSVNTGRLQIEIRTVNHRHFSASLKLCSPLQSLESDLRSHVRGRLERGHVTITARWVEEPERKLGAGVNLERAREVVRVLTELKDALDLPGEIDIGFVARQPDVFVLAQGIEDSVDAEQVFGVADAAVAKVVAMREREGAALAAAITDFIAELETNLELVEQRAPERLESERDRLRESVTQLLDGRPLDDDRLYQEIAFIADKLDITEEIVRLRSHIDVCRHALQREGPVGRELAFVGQEMLREINTIGSKANDAAIANTVIVMKGIIEKFREQVENLE